VPAASPWIDTAAPAQWQLGAQGQQAEQTASQMMNAAANNTSVDTTLHWKVSGTIILALILIFGLQAMGFRFVTSASIGVGR